MAEIIGPITQAEDLKETMGNIARDAVVAAEGGWGGSELQEVLVGIAEEATLMCEKYDIEYEVYTLDPDTDDYRVTKTTKAWGS